jgi:PAS domain S-box-containing protein
VLCGALLAAYVISRALRKNLSEPILSLARAAETVTTKADYSVRAEKFSDDELGKLTTTFNEMLGTIQEHQSRLRESEERFRTLGDNIAQLAWMADHDGTLVWYNKRWYEYTGTTSEQMQVFGRQLVHHPEHKDRVIEKWNAHLKKGVQWEDTFPLRGADGQFCWFLSRAYPIRDANGKIVRWFGTNTDITELRETQEALQLAQSKLQQHADTLEQTVTMRTAELKDTNEQLEALVYSIAHDLRAPLRSMQGFSELLVNEQPGLTPEGRDYLQRIRTSADYMDRMIIDLLAFGRTSRGQVELKPVDIETVWKSAVFQCARAIELTGAKIEVTSPLRMALAHEPTLTQVLANLLNNALKFVTPGTAPRIRFSCIEHKHSVQLWIEDNGIGIDPQYHDRIFRVFERLHGQTYGGTGIGLAIVRKGVERMQGRIGLESEIGKGTRFWIELRKP